MRKIAFAGFFALTLLGLSGYTIDTTEKKPGELPFAFSETGEYSARIYNKKAIFEFSIPVRDKWEWYSFAKGQEYSWNVVIDKYSIGFFLFCPSGTIMPESGSFQELLAAGQFSVFESEANGTCSVIQGIDISGKVNKEGNMLIIEVLGEDIVQNIFSSKPKSCRFKSVIEGETKFEASVSFQYRE